MQKLPIPSFTINNLAPSFEKHDMKKRMQVVTVLLRQMQLKMKLLL